MPYSTGSCRGQTCLRNWSDDGRTTPQGREHNFDDGWVQPKMTQMSDSNTEQATVVSDVPDLQSPSKKLTVIVPVGHTDRVPEIALSLGCKRVHSRCYDDYPPPMQIFAARYIVERLKVRDAVLLFTASDYVLRELSNMLACGECAKRGTPLPCAASLGYTGKHTLTIEDIDVWIVRAEGSKVDAAWERVALSDHGFIVEPTEDFISQLSSAMQQIYRDLACMDEPTQKDEGDR